MASRHKAVKKAKTPPGLSKFVKEVISRFDPEAIILFGSYARGTDYHDSDVDLLILMETRFRPIEQAIRIRQEIPRNFPMDLIVMSPGVVSRRIAKGDTFLQEIIREGRVLYERDNRRVDKKSRRRF